MPTHAFCPATGAGRPRDPPVGGSASHPWGELVGIGVAARHAADMATTTTPQDIETTVIENLVSFGADPDAVSRDATLEDIDVDSLDLVELTQVVEESYGIDLDGADFKKIKTVGDMVDLVVERVQG